jgi:hypothetical protein
MIIRQNNSSISFISHGCAPFDDYLNVVEKQVSPTSLMYDSIRLVYVCRDPYGACVEEKMHFFLSC